MILASQFTRFMQPLAIMAALPLTLIGVIVALLIARYHPNVISIIGFILLMGLVTKNAILLVDFAPGMTQRRKPDRRDGRRRGSGCGRS